MSNVIEQPLSHTVSQPFASELSEIMTAGTRQVLSKMKQLRNVEPPSMASTLQGSLSVHGGPNEVEVFEALSRAKRYVSSVAMHLDKVWRERLFRKLDNLHDVEEWEDADRPVVFSSFESFIRTFLTLRPKSSPALGLTGRGYVVAAWIVGKDRLTMEFLPNGIVRATLVYESGCRTERAAVETYSDRLLQVLNPYNPSHWFEDEIRSASS